MRGGQQGPAFEGPETPQTGTKQVGRQQGRVTREVELIAIGDYGVRRRRGEHRPKAGPAGAAQNDLARFQMTAREGTDPDKIAYALLGFGSVVGGEEIGELVWWCPGGKMAQEDNIVALSEKWSR